MLLCEIEISKLYLKFTTWNSFDFFCNCICKTTKLVLVVMKCVLAILMHGFPFVSNFKRSQSSLSTHFKYLLLLLFFMHQYLGQNMAPNVGQGITVLSFWIFFLQLLTGLCNYSNIKILLLLINIISQLLQFYQSKHRTSDKNIAISKYTKYFTYYIKYDILILKYYFTSEQLCTFSPSNYI